MQLVIIFLYTPPQEIVIESDIMTPEVMWSMNRLGEYAVSPDGYIGVYGDNFTETICHELGHLFDKLNVEFIFGNPWSPDYNKFNLGVWDKLTEEYADEIYSIRIGADIGCGYSVEGMYDKHTEFYAEAFQLYFYSPETRAALPEEVRERIEWELEEYVYNRD